MKKAVIAIICGLSVAMYFQGNNPTTAEAYTEAEQSFNGAVSLAVSVSTTPALITTGNTTVNRGELRVWNYGSDVIYLTFGTTTSSTTAAANGIKVFASSENNEYISLPLDNDVQIYSTLAADSGTSSLRIVSMGRRKP